MLILIKQNVMTLTFINQKETESPPPPSLSKLFNGVRGGVHRFTAHPPPPYNSTALAPV